MTMRWFRFFSHGEQGAALAPTVEPIRVPPGQRALVLRDGVPEEVFQEGAHAAPTGPGPVEVRLLAPGAHTRAGGDLPPGGMAALPYSRSWLHQDGRLIGMVVQPLRPRRSRDHHPGQLSDWP
jgi:hypothetical protein